jgi:hypothetical protein
MAKKSCGSDSKHEMKEYGKSMPKGKSSGMKKPAKKSSKKMK